jgi:hypothetical protein
MLPPWIEDPAVLLGLDALWGHRRESGHDDRDDQQGDDEGRERPGEHG